MMTWFRNLLSRSGKKHQKYTEMWKNFPSGKKSIIFIDIDGPLISGGAAFLPSNRRLVRTFDPVAVALLNNLFERDGNLYAVIHSSWLCDISYMPSLVGTRLLDHFEAQGCKFRWHKDWAAIEDNWVTSRWKRISQWVQRHFDEVERIFIIEDHSSPHSGWKDWHIEIDFYKGFNFYSHQTIVNSKGHYFSHEDLDKLKS